MLLYSEVLFLFYYIKYMLYYIIRLLYYNYRKACLFTLIRDRMGMDPHWRAGERVVEGLEEREMPLPAFIK